MMSPQELRDRISEDGFALLPGILPREFVLKCRAELERAIPAEAERYGPAARRDYGMVLLCSLYGGTFNQVFDFDDLMAPFNAVLGDRCIVYAYTSSSMPPDGGNYSVRVHVDCPRIIPGYITNMGATIALDDFSEENGATYFLPGSQTRAEPPSESEFFAKAKRFLAPAGSVLYFNARLWHSGGLNRTQKWRHALTINMCRSYMKQRIDIPRAMAGINFEGLSDNCRQKLGFYVQPPASVDEYYLPEGQRSYRGSAE